MTLPCTYGVGGLHLTAEERDLIEEANPWGFILFARNVQTPDQLRNLTDDLRETAGRDVPILIDQEGGRVQRMGPPHWRQWDPPLDQMQSVADPGLAARVMKLRYRLIAEELRSVGVDVNCAPLADIARPDTHPILRNRLYGSDHVAVIGAARAVAQGLLEGGVLPVLKHMPGLGRGTLDSHLDLPRVEAARRDLETEDFAAFRGLSDLPLGMSAHIVFEAIDPHAPATISPTMIRLIREDIGFDGLLMTDDISMQALSGSVVDRGMAALAAGCDLVLHCNGNLDEMEALARRLPPMSDAACRRTAQALGQRRSVPSVDIAELEAEFEGLVGRAQADGAYVGL